MLKKKILIGLVVTIALSLVIAGAAYAAVDGRGQGFQGGTAAVAGTATQAQDGSGTECDGICDGDGDGICDGTCDGTCDGDATSLQQRDRLCDGTCDESTTQTQDQQGQRSGRSGR